MRSLIFVKSVFLPRNLSDVLALRDLVKEEIVEIEEADLLAAIEDRQDLEIADQNQQNHQVALESLLRQVLDLRKRQEVKMRQPHLKNIANDEFL